VLQAATTQLNHDQSLNIENTIKHFKVMGDADVHGMIMLGIVARNVQSRWASSPTHLPPRNCLHWLSFNFKKCSTLLSVHLVR